jgi:hypothetical protein
MKTIHASGGAARPDFKKALHTDRIRIEKRPPARDDQIRQLFAEPRDMKILEAGFTGRIAYPGRRNQSMFTEAEAIEREIQELGDENIRLAFENEELKGSLLSLISSLKNIRLSELPDGIEGVGKKLKAILETGRARGVPAESRTAARFAGYRGNAQGRPRRGLGGDRAGQARNSPLFARPQSGPEGRPPAPRRQRQRPPTAINAKDSG